MRPRGVALLTVAAAAAHGAAAAPDDPVEYRVESVHRTLLREDPDGGRRLAAGDAARSGERLRTGWFSRAEIVAPAFASRFRLAARTRVELAAGRPGLLLHVERGRVRAQFGGLAGGDPPARLVTTPSAVLAVRGTSYGVQVDRSGDTTVVVFEGTVEVGDLAGAEPATPLGPGQALRVRHGERPGPVQPHAMTPRQWDQGRAVPPPAAGPAGPGHGTAPGIQTPPRPPRGGGSGRHGG
jgi:hypothetical protein